MIQYIRKKGNDTFSVRAPNEIDYAFLAWVSYLDFPGLYEKEGSPFVLGKSTFKDFVSDKGENLRFMLKDVLADRENYAFAHGFFASKRYADVRLVQYRVIENKEAKIQYGAFLLEVSKDLYVLSFRGTNLNLYGWEEDCLMLLGDIPSDALAVEDLLKMEKAVPQGAKLVLAGHSKGGHLACYAPLYVPEEVQDRIQAIYSFDGPGAYSPLKEHPFFARLKDKLRKYVPENDWIGGLLMDYKGAVRIVNAVKGNGIAQHSVMTWLIKGDLFDRKKERTKSSYVLEKTLDEWVYSYDNRTKKEVIAGLSAFLDECGFQKISDFGANFLSQMRSIMTVSSKSDKNGRNSFFKAAQEFVRRYIKNYFSYKKENKDSDEPAEKKGALPLPKKEKA